MRRFVPWIISVLLVSWVALRMVSHKQASGFDLDGFGRLPVRVGGRVMPMDTLARLSLSLMNHRGSYSTDDGKAEPASRWLLEVLMRPERANAATVFEVTNPDVLGLFDWQEAKGKPVSYSYNDLEPFLGEIGRQAGLAMQAKAPNPFQRGVLKLREALRTYLLLKNSLQAEDSPDFGKEIEAFEGSILPGLKAIRDREANKPFNRQDLQRIFVFAQR